MHLSLASRFFLVSIFFFSTPILHAEDKIVSPFEVQPFKVPASIKEIDGKYRSKWTRLTGFELSGLHWNTFIVVYTNSGFKTFRTNYLQYLKEYEAFEEDEEYEAKYRTYPEGTVILKENYVAVDGIPKNPLSLTVMIKREKGFSPEYGDWEFIESSQTGDIMLRGKGDDKAISARCSSCHKNIAARDYIFSTFFSDTTK